MYKPIQPKLPTIAWPRKRVRTVPLPRGAYLRQLLRLFADLTWRFR